MASVTVPIILGMPEGADSEASAMFSGSKRGTLTFLLVWRVGVRLHSSLVEKGPLGLLNEVVYRVQTRELVGVRESYTYLCTEAGGETLHYTN